ncbi:MAG: DUF4197 domain-containing protein [Psychroflexus sp.]|nr:DUF4197 domain-containing protein [Psychroflexus sp.]MDR9449040.1 DUF4197 domain-containing protein [Psychroflexus sp.]
MKKISLILILLCTVSCAELQTIADQTMKQSKPISNLEISNGLKQALEKGVEREVNQLTQKNGFYENDAVKVLLPEELTQVEEGLRKIGLGSLADEGIKLMNRAAEDAVKKATPIFIDAIKNMSINDARNILLGNDSAATDFLKQSTANQLYQEFYPVVNQSFKDVGADQLWTSAIDKYNRIPFKENVNPDLSEYVTQQALDGVFKMIAKEEVQIRNQLSSRSTDLLRRVFKLQD